MTATGKKLETPEEEVIRKAAEVHAQTANPDAAQPVEKQPSIGKKDGEDSAFEGQHIQNDSFSIITGDALGRPIVRVSPTNWVGEAPLVIHGSKVKDLISALKQLKNLPDEPKQIEVNAGTGSDPE